MEYTKKFIKEMENLKSIGKFYDYTLKNEVEAKMLEIENNATDEQLLIFSQLDESADDEIFYTHIHAIAKTFNIK